jgi:signal transduction histidine kinase
LSISQTQPDDEASTNPEAGTTPRYPGYGKVFLIWTAIGLLTSLRYQMQRPTNSGVGDLQFMAAFTASYYPWVALTPAVFRIERKFPLGAENWFRNLCLLAVLSIPVCLLAAPLMSGAFFAVLSLPPAGRATSPAFWFGAHFPMAQLLFWCSAGVGYFVRTQFQLREQQARTARLALEKSQLEAGLRQAQLDAIRARLNPHFLFNSLQNISVMTKQDGQTASRMLARLGDLLRAVLRQDSEPESTLGEEMELTKAYVALEQMRFGDRLRLNFHIVPEANQALVPPFLLQPLVENAIIHGLRGVAKTGEISVSAARQNGELVLTVTDNGIGPNDDAISGRKLGVGLGSTRDRLATMYPERHTFALQKRADGGTEIRIAIPFHLAPHQERTLCHEQAASADR